MAEADPVLLISEAEDLIEEWLCELDSAWVSTLAEAKARAAAIMAEAEADAAVILAGAARMAEAKLTDPHLQSLSDAVARLRSELSAVVDAAFDALPALEATADALDIYRPAPLVEDVPDEAPLLDTWFEPDEEDAPSSPRPRLWRRLLTAVGR